MEKEYQAADEITKSLVEIWNGNNPTKLLNGDLTPMIKEHIRYAYVEGWEQLRRDVKEILMARESDKIDRYFLVAKLDFLEKKS
jgi:hypothetical protein